MNQESGIYTDQEFLKTIQGNKGLNAMVSILDFDATQLHNHLDTNVHLRSSLFILVLNGTAEIEINFRRYSVSSEKIILLSFGHFFKIHDLSQDFQALVLYVSKEYIKEMYSTEMIYKRVKFGVRMHNTPLLNLKKREHNILRKRINFIDEIAANKQHRYLKEITLNALLIFLLDLGNLIEKGQEKNVTPQSREEIYFQQFLELLVQNYKTEHHVEFYANKLHITTHYLTLIVKRLSGQSVSSIIFQLLYSEAKLLLQPNSSIQEIASELNFSDQSAFGKFFKRKSGLSPRDFKKR